MSFNFDSLFPIPLASGCGGAGRAGTGFLPRILRGSWEGTAGSSRSGGSCCGGLAVEPLLLFNFSSGTTILRSLFTDRRLQISGLGGEVWKPSAVLASVLFGVWGSCCL